MTEVVLDAVYWELMESGAPAFIQQWLVSEGEPVHNGQSLASIRIGHDTVVVPAPHTGMVEEILVGAGETFTRDSPLARLITV